MRRVVVVTRYWAKPIPIRKFDWEACLDGYEPGEPLGLGETEPEAVYELYMQIEEREAEQEEKARERATAGS